jgi:hypothetical protein
MYWFGTPPGDADARPWILVLLHDAAAGPQEARYHIAITIVFEVVVTLRWPLHIRRRRVMRGTVGNVGQHAITRSPEDIQMRTLSRCTALAWLSIGAVHQRLFCFKQSFSNRGAGTCFAGVARKLSIQELDPGDLGQPSPTRAFSATACLSFTIPSFAAMTLRSLLHHPFSARTSLIRHGEDYG